MRRIDPGFNVDWQARATLVALVHEFDIFRSDLGGSIHDTELLTIETKPFYNGRERHAAIVVRVGLNNPTLLISFGECRNSDSLMVWVSRIQYPPFDGITVNSHDEETFDSREGFSYGEVKGAAEYIANRVAKFIKG